MCFHHTLADGKKCKKEMGVGKYGTFTMEQCELRIKQWCILGEDIPVDAPPDMTPHHKLEPRNFVAWSAAVVQARKPESPVHSDSE